MQHLSGSSNVPNTSSFRKRDELSPLCSRCSSIPYDALFRRANPEFVGAIVENRDDRESLLRCATPAMLGIAVEIRERRSKCSLCRILTKALDQHQISHLHLCFLQAVPLCAWERREGRVPRGWSARMGLHAFLPGDNSDRQRVHTLLELQHCSSPTSTVKDAVPTTRLQYRGDYEAQIVVALCGPPDMREDPRLGGRLLDEQVNIGLLQSWIQTCIENDLDSCHSNTRAYAPGLMMIDVVDSCIVDINEPKWDAQRTYVALSYCWGQSPSLQLTRKTLPKLKETGTLLTEDVPLTIRDAMLLTGQLGFRFLWVDALCICQDDATATQTQIKYMDQIYSQAYLTIIAAAGEDSSAGLPGLRPGTRTISQEVVNLPCGNMITVIDGAPAYGRLRKSRWVTRAWTMQERLLAPRKLIFTETQVYWECRVGFFAEEMVLEGALKQQFFHDPVATKEEDAPLVTEGYNSPRAPDNYLDRLHPRDLLRHYVPLVEMYAARQMSFQSDALNAFTGIMNAISHQDESHHSKPLLTPTGNESASAWGLPYKFLNRALSWEWESSSRHGASSVVLDKAETSHALSFPSWCWAAWVPSEDQTKKGLTWFEDITAPHLVVPEINFHLEGVDGLLKAITELTSDNITLSQFYTIGGGQALRNQWKKNMSRDASSSIATTEATEEFISNGHLHVTTSTAKLKIYRVDCTVPTDGGNSTKDTTIYDAEPLDPSLKLSNPIRISLNNPSLLPWTAHPPGTPWPKRKTSLPPQKLVSSMDRFRQHQTMPAFLDMLTMVDTSTTKPEFQYPPFDWSKYSPIIETPGKRYTTEADFVVIGRSVHDPGHYLRCLIVTWDKDGEKASRIGCAWISERDWVSLENRKWGDVVLV